MNNVYQIKFVSEMDGIESYESGIIGDCNWAIRMLKDNEETLTAKFVDDLGPIIVTTDDEEKVPTSIKFELDKTKELIGILYLDKLEVDNGPIDTYRKLETKITADMIEKLEEEISDSKGNFGHIEVIFSDNKGALYNMECEIIKEDNKFKIDSSATIELNNGKLFDEHLYSNKDISASIDTIWGDIESALNKN